MKAVEK